MFCKTCVNSGTACTYFGVKFLCQAEQQVEVFFRTYSVTTGNDDRRAFQVVLRFFYVAFDYFNHIVCVGYVLLHVVADHFSLISRRNDFFLHHAFANGCHLWAVFGVDDGCNDVTAECRTDLVQQVLINFSFFLIFVVTDFKGCTVGSQTAGQSRRNTRAEVTADNGSAHQTDLRLFFFEEVYEDGSVRK